MSCDNFCHRQLTPSISSDGARRAGVRDRGSGGGAGREEAGGEGEGGEQGGEKLVVKGKVESKEVRAGSLFI